MVHENRLLFNFPFMFMNSWQSTFKEESTIPMTCRVFQQSFLVQLQMNLMNAAVTLPSGAPGCGRQWPYPGDGCLYLQIL